MDLIREWYTHYDEDLARVRRFWEGEGRCLVSVYSTAHAYRQCFDDSAILRAAPQHLREESRLPGLNLPAFFPDWGTISTAKYWGGEPRFDSTGGNIFVDPVARTLDEALQLEPLQPDHLDLDAYRAVSLYRQLCGDLGTDALWLRSPDMQGTLNTAGLVMDQEEMLVAMYTEPEKLHTFLGRICDFLIGYAGYLRAATSNRLCGNIWPYTFFPSDLGVSFTEDLMPLLSAELYKEFGIPYLRKMQAALGGLHIHCCGDWGRHAANLKESGLEIMAVEYHHPATTISELSPLAEQTVFIPYILLDRQSQFSSVVDYYRWLLKNTPDSYRYWFACAEDTPETRSFAGLMGY